MVVSWLSHKSLPRIDGIRRLLAHHVNPGIDRHGRYRGVTGPHCDIGKTAAREA
jgi:hypothetical protein